MRVYLYVHAKQPFAYLFCFNMVIAVMASPCQPPSPSPPLPCFPTPPPLPYPARKPVLHNELDFTLSAIAYDSRVAFVCKVEMQIVCKFLLSSLRFYRRGLFISYHCNLFRFYRCSRFKFYRSNLFRFYHCNLPRSCDHSWHVENFTE